MDAYEALHNIHLITRAVLDSANKGKSSKTIVEMQKCALRGIEAAVEKALAMAPDGEPEFPIGLMKGVIHTGSNR